MGREFVTNTAYIEVSIHEEPRSPVSKLLGRRKDLRGTFGVLACACSAAFVLLVNALTTIAVVVRHGVGTEGRHTLYEGECKIANMLDTVLHLFINILSTGLLGCSNYSMQCLSAPTRKEIDTAHSKGLWLDVRILSTRNLRRVEKKRVVMY